MEGTIDNQEWISHIIILPHASLQGGIVTGYMTNHGTMSDFEFRGAVLTGGRLAGTIINTNQVGGYFKDVELAAGTKILGGKIAGYIKGDEHFPALLEHVKIAPKSVLQYVLLGDEVTLGDQLLLEKGV